MVAPAEQFLGSGVAVAGWATGQRRGPSRGRCRHLLLLLARDDHESQTESRLTPRSPSPAFASCAGGASQPARADVAVLLTLWAGRGRPPGVHRPRRERALRLFAAYWAAYGIGALVSSLIIGTRRARENRTVIVLMVAGWGACLIPFGFAPIGVKVGWMPLGGLGYGPFIPLTYAIFQSATNTANLPSLLAARCALTVVATPLGTVVGGPLVAAIGAAATLPPSGPATILLAACTSFAWWGHRRPRGLLAPGWTARRAWLDLRKKSPLTFVSFPGQHVADCGVVVGQVLMAAGQRSVLICGRESGEVNGRARLGLP